MAKPSKSDDAHGEDASAPGRFGRKLQRPEPEPVPEPEAPARVKKAVPPRAPRSDGPRRQGAPTDDRGRGQNRRSTPGAGIARTERSRDGSERPRPPRERDAASDAGRTEREKPFRPARRPTPRRPELPDERPIIPREAWRDIRATAPQLQLDDVVKAVGAAADALEAGNFERATALLEWAKNVAPRTATIREALGVTHYAAERYGPAHSELLTYRRLSGNHDQNHLLADCVRATGRPEKAEQYIDEMIAARVEQERLVEGLIVLSGVRADAGDLEGALQTLQRVELDPETVQPWHPRIWYAVADVLERLDRPGEARDYFEAITSVDDEFGDVAERLARLADED